MNASASPPGCPADRIVRPLTPEDLPAFHALCAQDPLRFLPVRLNIERDGLDSPDIRCWGAFAPGSAAMQGVLIRFGNTLMVTDLDGSCGTAFAPVVDNESGLAGIRGTLEIVRALQNVVRAYAPSGMEISHYLRLLHPPRCAPARLSRARRAHLADLDRLAALYAQAGEMYRSRANVEAKLRSERVFVVEEPASLLRPARIVSCALTNIEGRDAGIIGGVFTLPEARGKGYAGACTAALALDLQRDGKMPCLFYENPIAGVVYRHLGFEEIGQWGLLYLTPRRRFT